MSASAGSSFLDSRELQSRHAPGQKDPVALVVIGESCVGKSTVVDVLSNTSFPSEVDPTPGSKPRQRIREVPAQIGSIRTVLVDTPPLITLPCDPLSGTPPLALLEQVSSFSDFLAEGGHVLWVIPDVSPLLLPIVKALNQCCPGWDRHALVVCRGYRSDIFRRVKEETQEDVCWAAGGACKAGVKREAAERYDEERLRELNELVREQGVEFPALCTFSLGSSRFGAHRLLAWAQDLVASVDPYKLPAAKYSAHTRVTISQRYKGEGSMPSDASFKASRSDGGEGCGGSPYLVFRRMEQGIGTFLKNSSEIVNRTGLPGFAGST